MSRAENRRRAREVEAVVADNARLTDWLGRIPPPEPVDPAMDVNIYACPECGRPTVTQHFSAGVTPFVLGCRANVDLFDADGMAIDPDAECCEGFGRSVMYQLPPPESTPWAIVELLADPPWVWYRPTTIDQLRGLDAAVLHHLTQGGLLLAKRDGATGCAPNADDLADIADDEPRRKRFMRALAKRTTLAP